MNRKAPSLQFYPGDWLKDPELSKCTPATRGIWMDILCGMHEAERAGEVSGTTKQLSQLCRCSIEEFNLFVDEISTTKTADVTVCNEIVTIINRRMKREYKIRQATNKRVFKHRHKKSNGNSNENVTPSRARFSSSSSSIKENIKEKDVTFLSSLSKNNPIISSFKNGDKKQTEPHQKEYQELKEKAISIIKYFNEKTGKHFPEIDNGSLDSIKEIIGTGATIEDCKNVIDNFCQDEYYQLHNGLLRPAHIFSYDNFYGHSENKEQKKWKTEERDENIRVF